MESRWVDDTSECRRHFDLPTAVFVQAFDFLTPLEKRPKKLCSVVIMLVPPFVPVTADVTNAIRLEFELQRNHSADDAFRVKSDFPRI